MFVVMSNSGLFVLHYREVIIWDYVKGLQHLIEHLPMLAGDAYKV